MPRTRTEVSLQSLHIKAACVYTADGTNGTPHITCSLFACECREGEGWEEERVCVGWVVGSVMEIAFEREGNGDGEGNNITIINESLFLVWITC